LPPGGGKPALTTRVAARTAWRARQARADAPRSQCPSCHLTLQFPESAITATNYLRPPDTTTRLAARGSALVTKCYRRPLGWRAISAVILSPPWGVSHVALRGRWACRGRVILTGVSHVADMRRPTLTWGAPLLGAAFGCRFPAHNLTWETCLARKNPFPSGLLPNGLKITADMASRPSRRGNLSRT
jgi:hypothetical protein